MRILNTSDLEKCLNEEQSKQERYKRLTSLQKETTPKPTQGEYEIIWQGLVIDVNELFIDCEAVPEKTNSSMYSLHDKIRFKIDVNNVISRDELKKISKSEIFRFKGIAKSISKEFRQSYDSNHGSYIAVYVQLIERLVVEKNRITKSVKKINSYDWVIYLTTLLSVIYGILQAITNYSYRINKYGDSIGEKFNYGLLVLINLAFCVIIGIILGYMLRWLVYNTSNKN